MADVYRFVGSFNTSKGEVLIGKDNDYLYYGILVEDCFVEQNDYEIDKSLPIEQEIQSFIKYIEDGIL